MTINIEKLRNDLKWETRKFAISVILAGAAAVGAGVGIGSYFTSHSQMPTSQQPMFPPGTVITIPRAHP
jgi:hypothetical protein